MKKPHRENGKTGKESGSGNKRITAVKINPALLGTLPSMIAKKTCMIRNVVLLLTFFLCFQTGAQTVLLPAPFKILPQPQQVVLQKGAGLVYGQLQQLTIKGIGKRPVMGPFFPDWL